MNRPKGASRPCGRPEALVRLADARDFLEIASLAEASKVRATNAIHAAVAAADAITCSAIAARSADGNHRAAADLLATVDPRLGSTLKRALDLKTRAGYQTEPLSAGDANRCVEWAAVLIAAAENRGLVRGGPVGPT